LFVTITLLGILVALSLPSFSKWIRNSQIRTTAESLQTGIRTAEAEAVRRNRLVVLSFTNSAPALNATAVAGGKNWQIQAVAQFGESSTDTTRFISSGTLGDIDSTVTIADYAGAGISAICFNSNGRVTVLRGHRRPGSYVQPAPVTFVVNQTSADRPLRIIVQVGGQLRMCDPNRPTLSSTSPDGCP